MHKASYLSAYMLASMILSGCSGTSGDANVPAISPATASTGATTTSVFQPKLVKFYHEMEGPDALVRNGDIRTTYRSTEYVKTRVETLNQEGQITGIKTYDWDISDTGNINRKQRTYYDSNGSVSSEEELFFDYNELGLLSGIRSDTQSCVVITSATELAIEDCELMENTNSKYFYSSDGTSTGAKFWSDDTNPLYDGKVQTIRYSYMNRLLSERFWDSNGDGSFNNRYRLTRGLSNDMMTMDQYNTETKEFVANFYYENNELGQIIRYGDHPLNSNEILEHGFVDSIVYDDRGLPVENWRALPGNNEKYMESSYTWTHYTEFVTD